MTTEPQQESEPTIPISGTEWNAIVELLQTARLTRAEQLWLQGIAQRFQGAAPGEPVQSDVATTAPAAAANGCVERGRMAPTIQPPEATNALPAAVATDRR